MTDDYEYRGLMARGWDLLRGDYSTWPDRLVYRAIIERRGGASLDVGCGTGRLLLDYLASGFDVDGVDNSPEMLALCRDKAAALDIAVADRLFEQGMESLALPRLYATIFVASLSFQLLTDPQAAAAAMAGFRDHLAPGGMLVVSFSSRLWPGRRTPPQMQWSDWYRLAEQHQPEDGATLRRWIRARYDHDQQLQHEENRYELLRDGVVIETEHHARSPCVRWYSQTEAVACFQVAGFTEINMTSKESFDSATLEDARFKVIGTRT